MENNTVSTVTAGAPTSVQLLHATLRFVRVARFRWTLIAVVTLVVCVLSLLYYVTVDRVYQARAQLLVQQTGPIVTSNGTTDITSQQGMLPTYERLFTSTVVLEGAIQRLMDLPRARRIDFLSAPQENWVAILRGKVAVRSLRLTNVIEVAYGSEDPLAAEAVVQSLLDSYIEFMKANHQTVAGELVEILRNERKNVEQALYVKERQLIQAKRQFGDIGLRDATKTLHPLVQRVVRINESLVEVQQNRLDLEASRIAIERAIAEGSDLRQHLFTIEPVIGREVVLAAMGMSEQDEQTVARLEQQLIDNRSELDALQQHYGKRHPKVKNLHDSIQQTNVYLANYQQAVDRRSERLQDPHLGEMVRNLVHEQLLKTREQERILTAQYEQAQLEAVQLQGEFEEIAMLQREVDRLLNLNHTLLNHIDNVDINQNQSDVRVEIVSRPQASRRPVSPNPMVVILASLFASVSIGAGLVYVVDVLDDRFRSLDEMKAQLQTPILSMVRQLQLHAPAGLQSLQVHVAPDAVESEAFRTLRTTLAFSADALECVAVSSSEPGDGKTTVVANLGVSFAQTGRKTLLIDADLRRPGLTRLFEKKGRPGLTEILRHQDDVATTAVQLVETAGHENLDVLPCGTRPLDPTGLLSSTRFDELLAWATTHYDQVVVDSPPMLVASDAAIVGRAAGGLMLVVQPQKNHRRLVVRAIEEARTVGLNVIGIIVNRLTSEPGHTYYTDSYGYGYGYGKGYHDGSPDDAATNVASESSNGSDQADVGPSAEQEITVDKLIAQVQTENPTRRFGVLRRRDAT